MKESVTLSEAVKLLANAFMDVENIDEYEEVFVIGTLFDIDLKVLTDMIYTQQEQNRTNELL